MEKFSAQGSSVWLVEQNYLGGFDGESAKITFLIFFALK